MKTIVLTGGGTAGHIMPNLALIPQISNHFKEIYYLGSKNSMEEKLVKDYPNIKFIPIPTVKLVRRFTLKNFLIPFKLINGINTTKKVLKKIKPDVIFCKGGFVSVPVAIAGKKCKIPVISHESDLSMGLANKVILKYANAVCTTFKDTAKISNKCICTGSPIREQIFKGNKQNVLKDFKNYNPKLPFVLVFGGSLGSVKINKVIEENIDELLKNYNVLHILGKNNINNINKNGYFKQNFADNIQDYFALADIVVCRGGANSLFELLALLKPMLIIPLSKAQSRGDQIENAEYFKRNKFAEVLREENLTGSSLISKLEYINKNKEQIILNMKKNKTENSNETIINVILNNCK